MESKACEIVRTTMHKKNCLTIFTELYHRWPRRGLWRQLIYWFGSGMPLPSIYSQARHTQTDRRGALFPKSELAIPGILQSAARRAPGIQVT